MGIRLMTPTMPVNREALPLHQRIIADVLKQKFNVTDIEVLNIEMGVWWEDLSPGTIPIKRETTELVVNFRLAGGAVQSFSAEREHLSALILRDGQVVETTFLASTFRAKYEDLPMVFTAYPQGQDNTKPTDIFHEEPSHPLDYTTDDVLLFTASALNMIKDVADFRNATGLTTK